MGLKGAFANFVGPKLLSCRHSLQGKHHEQGTTPFRKNSLTQAFMKAGCDQTGMKGTEISWHP